MPIKDEVFNELQRFVTEKNIVMKDGLVTGDLTPQEVLHLGYMLIAWVVEDNTTPEELMNIIGEEVDKLQINI